MPQMGLILFYIKKKKKEFLAIDNVFFLAARKTHNH